MRRRRNSLVVQILLEQRCSPRRHTLPANPGVVGRVSISNGVVQVTTSAQEPTILLSIIGIRSVTGEGSARANIVPTGDSR